MPILYFGMSVALQFKLFADGVKITNIHGWDLECSGRLYETALNRLLIGLAIAHVILLNQCFWNNKWTLFSCNLFAVSLIIGFYLFIRTKARTTLNSILGVIDKVKFQNITARDKSNWVFRYSHPYIRILGTKRAIQVMNEINSPVSQEPKVHPLLEKEKRFNLPIPTSSISKKGGDSQSHLEEPNELDIVSPRSKDFFFNDQSGFTSSVKALSNPRHARVKTEPDKNYRNNEAKNTGMHTLLAESRVMMLPKEMSLHSFPSNNSGDKKSRDLELNNRKVSNKEELAAGDLSPRSLRALNHELLVRSYASSPSRISHFRRDEQELDFEEIVPELELPTIKINNPVPLKFKRHSSKKLSQVQEIDDEEPYDHNLERIQISNDRKKNNQVGSATNRSKIKDITSPIQHGESYLLDGPCDGINTYHQNRIISDSPSVVPNSRAEHTGIPDSLLPPVLDRKTKSDIGIMNGDILNTNGASSKRLIDVVNSKEEKVISPHGSEYGHQISTQLFEEKKRRSLFKNEVRLGSNILCVDAPIEKSSARFSQLRVLSNPVKAVKPKDSFIGKDGI